MSREFDRMDKAFKKWWSEIKVRAVTKPKECAENGFWAGYRIGRALGDADRKRLDWIQRTKLYPMFDTKWINWNEAGVYRTVRECVDAAMKEKESHP